MADELVTFDEIKAQNLRLKSSLDSKINKVTNAKTGNIPVFSNDGALVDSGRNFEMLKHPVRYGYRINKNESDPYARVEYLYDAVGFTPASMNFSSGSFNYGSWQDVWFVKDNKPLMLKSDGTVDYYLDPNNYNLKDDGSASDVANTSYDGNAMVQFPLCWFKRYEDDDYIYEIVSNVQFDEDYHAYAHTDAEGNIKDFFYFEMFEASTVGSKLRSLSGQIPATTILLSTATQYIVNNGANDPRTNGSGNGWYLGSWSQKECIRTLCVLLSKSTDSQAAFGNGRNYNRTGQNLAGEGRIKSGSLLTSGQFFGYNNSWYNAVKVFHVENFWGNQTTRCAGIFDVDSTFYVKMTPEGAGYNVTGDISNMSDTGITYTVSKGHTFATGMKAGDFGLLACAWDSGSSSTYFSDATLSGPCSGTAIVSYGGSAWHGYGYAGVFFLLVHDLNYIDFGTGFSMSYI